jgi:hypothetical protein
MLQFWRFGEEEGRKENFYGTPKERPPDRKGFISIARVSITMMKE